MYPSDVILDINRGKLYLSGLNEQYLDDMKKGCCGCDTPSFRCLLGIITCFDALDYTSSASVYDDIAQDLYMKLLVIIGDAPVADNFTVNYGFYNTPQVPSTIVFAFSKQVPVGSTSFTLDFTSAIFSSDKYIAFDQPVSEVIKTIWVNDPAFNYGTIPDSVFNSSVEVNGRNIVVSRTPFVAFVNNSNVKFSN